LIKPGFTNARWIMVVCSVLPRFGVSYLSNVGCRVVTVNFSTVAAVDR